MKVNHGATMHFVATPFILIHVYVIQHDDNKSISFNGLSGASRVNLIMFIQYSDSSMVISSAK